MHDFLVEIAPPTVTVEVKDLHGGESAITPRDIPEMQAAAQAYTEGFGQRPIFVREGGSIPVVTHLQKILGLNTVLMGFGLPDDRLHSPNEKFHLPNFHRGIETVIHFWHQLADI